MPFYIGKQLNVLHWGMYVTRGVVKLPAYETESEDRQLFYSVYHKSTNVQNYLIKNYVLWVVSIKCTPVMPLCACACACERACAWACERACACFINNIISLQMYII